MNDVKPTGSESCILCEGTGEVLERKVRQMGYTIAPSEPSDVLEEKLVPCPLCGVTANKCELCGRESPQLETKTATVEVECCPQCALEWDAVKFAEKTGRRQFLRELSYRWANGLHGQKVVVHSDEDTHPSFCDVRSKYHVMGTAHRIQNAGGGWGQVRVDIAPSENHRIRENPRYRGYGIMDDQEFGLFLNAVGDGNWYATISWGCRKALDLVEAQ